MGSAVASAQRVLTIRGVCPCSLLRVALSPGQWQERRRRKTSVVNRRFQTPFPMSVGPARLGREEEIMFSEKNI
jgi:hypothetical protein